MLLLFSRLSPLCPCRKTQQESVGTVETPIGQLSRTFGAASFLLQVAFAFSDLLTTISAPSSQSLSFTIHSSCSSSSVPQLPHPCPALSCPTLQLHLCLPLFHVVSSPLHQVINRFPRSLHRFPRFLYCPVFRAHGLPVHSKCNSKLLFHPGT